MDLAGFDRDTLAAELAVAPPHAHALLRRFYDGFGVPDLTGLELPKRTSERLARDPLTPAASVSQTIEAEDGTVRMISTLTRGGVVESVLMPSSRPGEAWCCVSSQVGCAMGCRFCASTRGGLERDLTVEEIVWQFLHLGALAATRGRRLKRLVFMGMGEPLHNFTNVLRAIRHIGEPTLGRLGFKPITVSTVGVVPGMVALTEANPGVHLAVSLHAPDDETRARIVPIAKKYPLDEVLAAARAYEQRADRILTFAYTLLEGVNDSDEHARALAARVKGFRAHLNLIPYNPIGDGAPWVRSSPERTHAFVAILREAGLVAHARRTRGDDVDAACGQLRSRFERAGRRAGSVREPAGAP
jgi:23S rRNA (adenine2503-C2)-methyltransferase